MTLTPEQLDELVRIVRLTREDELDCQQCLENIAEFAETQLIGKSVHQGLQAVAHHLSICVECREEYEILLSTLRQLGRRKESNRT